MKAKNANPLLAYLKKVIPIWTLLFLLLISSCSPTDSVRPALKIFTLAVPSATELYFGEKRDFYVVAYFEQGAPVLSNVRIELFRGEIPLGAPVRLLESRLDENGVTPDAAILQHYAEGQGWNLDKAPDLVLAPGGFRYPGNKLLVTQKYFAGIILGGATKDFDTDYVDASGAPLEDLTEGVYTLRVTVFSQGFILQAETLKLYFKPVFKLFGAFQPANHESKLKAYAAANGYRVFLDPFAGYFFPEGYSVGNYKINKRWRPQNSLEVVNTVNGTSYGTPENARIGFILYNLVESGTTSRLEIGKALLTGVIDSPNTFFFRYDIGEPEIVYVNRASEEKTLAGAIVAFASADRLALTRAEIRARGTGDGDNRYYLYDRTPKTQDLNLADGLRIADGEEFSVYGVVKPIATSVTETSYLYYAADNRIARIRYRIRNAQGEEVAATVREINLGRIYLADEPERLFYSIFEFEHEFDFGALRLAPGTYTLETTALDVPGDEVAGTFKAITVQYALH
jgi:glycosyltransferase involved in cell wall biosynthesis